MFLLPTELEPDIKTPKPFDKWPVLFFIDMSGIPGIQWAWHTRDTIEGVGNCTFCAYVLLREDYRIAAQGICLAFDKLHDQYPRYNWTFNVVANDLLMTFEVTVGVTDPSKCEAAS